MFSTVFLIGLLTTQKFFTKLSLLFLLYNIIRLAFPFYTLKRYSQHFVLSALSAKDWRRKAEALWQGKLGILSAKDWRRKAEALSSPLIILNTTRVQLTPCHHDQSIFPKTDIAIKRFSGDYKKLHCTQNMRNNL
jgi:hypothetical protein